MAQFTTSPTLAQLRSQLAARLDDYNSTFWLAAELDSLIREALSTWNAYSWFYRDRTTFASVAGQVFYDISGSGVLADPAMLTPTVTDRQAINALQYALLEPITTNWTLNTPAMTEMFVVSDLANALQWRRDQLLMETGLIQTHSTQAITANASGRFNLSDTTIDVRRATWLRAGVYTSLVKTDDMSVNGFSTSSLTTAADPPISYSTILVQPVAIQLFPPPSLNGTLDLLTVKNPANLDPASSAGGLGIPDDLWWVAKWGALADLLGRDGQARDPLRAQYAQQRWQEGLMVAQMLPSVTAAYVAGSPVILGDIWSADGYASGWQNLTPAQPTGVLMGCWNTVALTPTPDGVYTITVDLLRNMPLPAVDADVVQVGKEIVDVILDYAEHLACFKMAGQEFSASMPLYERFTRTAMTWNSRLRAQATLFKYLFDRQDVETRMNRKKVPDELAAD